MVGIASSPEFVFAVAPGAMLPEPERFGVVWMDRESLARAFDRDGAFNEVVMRLEPGANFQAVAAQVDHLLARHGGRGAYGRDRMLSAQFMADELTSLRTMASILPPFFLVVAAFLLNVSLSRLVATERSNIGLLKSFGYSNCAIALHYAKFALVFGLIGAVVGMIGGWLVGGYVGGHLRQCLPDSRPALRRRPRRLHQRCWRSRCWLHWPARRRRVRRATRLAPAAALAPPAPTAFGRLGAAAERLAAKLDGKIAHGGAKDPAVPATLRDDGGGHRPGHGADGDHAAFSTGDGPHHRSDLRTRAARGRDGLLLRSRG